MFLLVFSGVVLITHSIWAEVQGHDRGKVSSSHATTIATGVGLCFNDASRAAGRGLWTIWRRCGSTRVGFPERL